MCNGLYLINSILNLTSEVYYLPILKGIYTDVRGEGEVGLTNIKNEQTTLPFSSLTERRLRNFQKRIAHHVHIPRWRNVRPRNGSHAESPILI